MSSINPNNNLREIIQKYLSGDITVKERAFLDNYYAYFEKNKEVLDQLSIEERERLDAEMWKIVKQRTRHHNISRPVHRWYMVAAAAVLVLAVVSVFLFSPTKKTEIVTAKNTENDKNPAVSSAQLILADGSVINLDSSYGGALPNQGEVELAIRDGRLEYSGSNQKVVFNTMVTPKGGNYQLTLSDHTKVWLNAASTIKFPASFTENKREVFLSGEAYFEVAKDMKPFKVIVEGKEEVEVLGTHFNINAYPDQQSTKTTLLEGKVKITPIINDNPDESKVKVLMPRQQAVIESGEISIKRNIDIENVMAWKNNVFYFENETLENILKELSRWYDVEIVYQNNGNIKNRKYFMIFNRDSKLSDVLKSLQISDIKFVIEGKKMIIK